MSASKTQQFVRPETLATHLGISGKVVRAHLRRTYTRPIEAKGTTWTLTQDQAKETIAHFKSLRAKDANVLANAAKLPARPEGMQG